jgi:hypothetical protein
MLRLYQILVQGSVLRLRGSGFWVPQFCSSPDCIGKTAFIWSRNGNHLASRWARFQLHLIDKYIPLLLHAESNQASIQPIQW